MAEPKTFTKTVSKTLNDAESAKLGRELCQLLDEIDVAKTYQREFNSEMKEKLDVLKTKANETRKAIESNTVEEHVECYEVEDQDRFEVRTHRKDTDTVIDTRAMTSDERKRAMQMSLPMTSDGGGPEGKVISMTQHAHEDDGEYHEGCTACWALKERPPIEPVDDATAMAESEGPGNEAPEPEPSDDELDEAVEGNDDSNDNEVVPGTVDDGGDESVA